MLDDTIEELTKLYIKEHLETKDNKHYVLTKEELIKFCIKLVKVIKKIDDMEVINDNVDK